MVSAMSPAQRAEATQDLLVKLLSARLGGGQRCCIAVDGGQRMHATSYRLLARMLQEATSRILIAVAIRTSPTGQSAHTQHKVRPAGPRRDPNHHRRRIGHARHRFSVC